MSAVLLTGLLALGTVGAPYLPANAYETTSDDRAGNIRSLKGVILEEGPNNPRIEIGELKLIGLADDERPGFVTAEEATLTDLKISGTIEGVEFSFVIPSAIFAGYRGPSLSVDQVQSDIFVHPSINWLGLIAQMEISEQEFSSGMTGEVKFSDSDVNIIGTLNFGPSSTISGNELVTIKWEPAEISFQAKDNDGEQNISTTFTIGKGKVIGNQASFLTIPAFLHPNDYPDPMETITQETSIDGMKLVFDAKLPSDSIVTSGSFEFGAINETNRRSPAFNLKTRMAVKKIIGDFARGNTDYKAVLQPHDMPAIAREFFHHFYVESSVEHHTLGGIHAEILSDDGSMGKLDIGSLVADKVHGGKVGQISYNDFSFVLSMPEEDLSMNLSFDEISANGFDLNDFYKNAYIPAYVQAVSDVIESDFEEIVDVNELVLEHIQALPLDDFYPKMGNWNIRNLSYSGLGVDVSMESFTTKQADNPGMPNSGTLEISNLTMPSFVLANELGPFAQLLANDDDLVNASLTYDWQTHFSEGGYEINELEVVIDQGLILNAAINLGGLPSNWQTVRINEFNPFALAGLVGFRSAKITLTNEGLAERGLDFVPLITGMAADEAKQFAKDNIEQALPFFLGSAEFAAPLQKALTSFVDEPGTLEIAVQPKAGGNLPFMEVQEKLAEGTSPETLFNYQASASN